MNKIIVVRAGSTAWDEEDRLQGTVPLPLSENGKASLEEIGERLCGEKPECLFSSGNETSGPTAEYLSKVLGLKHQKIVLLREMDFGLWQGLRIKDIQNRFCSAYKQWRNDPTSVCPPQGESLGDVQERVLEGMESIIKKRRDKCTVLVAGRIVSSVIGCLLTQSPLEKLWEIEREDSSVRHYELTSSQLKLLRGDTSGSEPVGKDKGKELAESRKVGF